MSTIKVSNIRIASESVSRPVTGVSAAWCHYTTASSTSIRASSNISSLSDAGTGDTNVYYTNDMASDDYPLSLATNSANIRETNTGHLAASCTVITSNSSGTAEDSSSVSVAVQGDLA